MSRNTKTYESLPEQGLLPMEFRLMSSQVGSPAKTQALQMSSVWELRAHALGFSQRRFVWLASLDQFYCWKTSQGCLVEGLETFSENWPEAGFMQNGNASALETWEPAIRENASLSWPTPAARDGKDLSRTLAYLAARKRHSPSMTTTLLENGTLWWQVSRFYEAAMGFPLQWSDGVYTDSETQSSPKSPNSLEEQS